MIYYAEEEGICFLDDRTYIPHITIIRSMFGCQRDRVKDVVSSMNKMPIPTFRINNISMLVPNRNRYEAERLVTRYAKELTVGF